MTIIFVTITKFLLGLLNHSYPQILDMSINNATHGFMLITVLSRILQDGQLFRDGYELSICHACTNT